MLTRQFAARAAGTLLALFSAVATGPVPANAQQPPTDRPWIFLSTNDKEQGAQNPSNPIWNSTNQSVLLRPNLEQTLYVYIRNPTEKVQDLTVVLANETENGDIIATEAVSVPARQTVRVRPPKPPDAPVGTKPVPPAAKPLPGRLYLTLRAGNDTLQSDGMPVSVQVPTQYVGVTAINFEGAPGVARNRLSVVVSDRKGQSSFVGNFPGPAAKVALDLSVARIPGLIPEPLRDSTLFDTLRSGGSVRLVASNLRFRPGADRNGVVGIDVDRYERAFLFETDFSGGRNPTDLSYTMLGLAAPKYWVPGKPCPIRLEVDRPPAAEGGLVVEFGIDRSNSGEFVTTTHDGERFQKTDVRWDPVAGGLVFITEFHDWVDEIDTAGMTGPRNLRLRLLSKKTGEVLKKEGRDASAVYDDVIVFDDTPPEAIRFGPIGKAIRNLKVDVSAFGVDPESGIAQVLFFVGEPPAPDGKPAPGSRVVPGLPPVEPDGPFTAQLPLPDRPGRLQIGVRFINNAGLIARDVLEDIEVVEPPPKPTTGAIKVKVVQGTDPRPQPGADVQLRDEKNTALLSTGKADDKGEITFEKLAPGKYTLFSNRQSDVWAKAMTVVPVEAGVTTNVTLELKR
jgi:hypothetical protein